MRGQASLETVVGLIILLVVAGVVISLVIYYVNPQKMPTGEQLEKTTFLTDCESYCKDLNSIDYCRYYFSGDWNKDGLNHQIVKVGKYNWQTCEDRIYCFLAQPCEERFGSGVAVMEKCRNMLCQAYMEKYNNITLATQALKDDIDVSKVCNLGNVPVQDRWNNTFSSCPT